MPAYPTHPDLPVIIVGGGLAGLTAAYRLHHSGVAFHLLEARDRLGGRILSADASGAPSSDGFDLGPSWFWPAHQHAIAKLASSLGLQTFGQHSDGDVVFHRMSREAPQRYQGMQQEPQSLRFVGGNSSIVTALADALPQESLRLDAQVTRVTLDGSVIDVRFDDARGQDQQMHGAQVLFALPPRLLAQTVAFTPAIDDDTSRRWTNTPTWMAPHAKVFALYDRPFWRDAGLSGTAQSMVGPLVEIHDATTASGKAALFGFVGVPSDQRELMGEEALKSASIEQLVMLFGQEAGTPSAILLKDWAADTLTSTPDDKVAGGHPVPDNRPWVTGVWSEHMCLIGSETSPDEPGYLAGAVVAAERAVEGVLGRLNHLGVAEKRPSAKEVRS